MRFDLHVHTEHSDGSMPIEDVVATAARIGLDGVAVTDHDSMDMVPRARRAADGTGLTILPGVELSALDAHTGRKLHLLVYGPHRPEALEPIFRRMELARRASGERMIELVCRRYPVTREHVLRHTQKSSTVFRVHIVRALIELGYDAQVYGPLYRELFAEPSGSCFIETEYTDADEAVEAARRSGGAVVLAHPGVYDSYQAAERLARAGLIDGIEFDYPRRNPADVGRHEALAREYGLIRTGGTDFHGFYSPKPHPLGSCVTEEYSLGQLHKLIEMRTTL